jgi:hypothetical protein
MSELEIKANPHTPNMTLNKKEVVNVMRTEKFVKPQ